MKPFEQDPHFLVIVSFIHTHALPFLLCRLRPFDGNAFDRLFRHLEIVSVRSIDGDADRNALPFSEQTPFCPLFCAVSGIRPSFFPPQAVLSSSLHPLNRNSNQYLSIHHISQDTSSRAF
jgi:hypothetical protein